MKSPTDIIELIRSTLQTGVVSTAVEQAAAAYADLCQDCAARLEQISAMLQKGSEHQAMQAAEEDPPLLDLVVALSFGGEKAWLDFCQAHHLPIAPKLDASTAQALDRLYSQGVTPNHPLYKDFRAAVLSRDDEKALKIIRTILKLNPGDENARLELERLENKRWQELLERLRAALRTDDEEKIAALVEKISSSIPAEKTSASTEMTQGENIRQALRRRQAGEKIPGLLEAAIRQRAAGEWQAVAKSCLQVRELVAAHCLELTLSQKKLLEEHGTYAQREQDTVERRRAFDHTMASFLNFTQEAGTRLMTGTPPGLTEASVLDANFIRQWRELESYGLPVADDVLARLRQSGEGIRSALESAQRNRRARTLLSGATLVAFLLAIAALAWHGWQAYAYTLELSSYRVRQVADPASRLIESLRHEQAALLRWPYLKSKVEETTAWLAQAADTSAQVEKTLAELEAETGDFNRLTPADLLARLQNVRSQISQLPADRAIQAGQRVSALKTRSEQALMALGKQRRETVSASLQDLAEPLKQGLSYERTAVEVEKTVQSLDQRLKELEPWLSPEHEMLQLSSEVITQLRSARAKVDEFKSACMNLDELRAKTLSVVTLLEFRQVLSGWQEVRFAEAVPAMALLSTLPDETEFLSALLTDGDPALLKATLEDASGVHLRPEMPQDSELKILLALRDDRNLNTVWEHTVVEHQGARGNRTVWSLGPLNESSVGDLQKRWSGNIYDPIPEHSSVIFSERDYKAVMIPGNGEQGQSIRSSRLAPLCKLMQSLQLDRMTDANGSRYERNLMSVFERLMGDTTAPTLARAYLIQELERLISDRPQSWGLHLCPTLRSDLAELHRITGGKSLRSEDWMRQKPGSDLGIKLTGYFQARQGRQYEKEALARRVLVTQVALGGVKLGGYVETDGQLRLNNTGRSAQEFWVLDKHGPVPLSVGTTHAPKGALALGPILVLPVNRAQLLDVYQSSLGGVGTIANQAPTADLTTPFMKP